MRKIMLGVVAAVTVSVPTLPVMAQRNGYYEGRTWQDRQGRTRCRKSNGTIGLIVGGAGGALAGRAIDTRGERTTGTVLGAAAGALIGRSVDRNRRGRCR